MAMTGQERGTAAHRVHASGAPLPSRSPQAMIDHLFAKLPSGLLLNLGSGDSTFEDEDRTVIGVDLFAPSTPVRRFVTADALTLPFASRSFDGALLKDVIEHVQDPIAVMIEVRRVIRADGRIVMTTPRAIPRAVWDDPTHIRGFTRHAIDTLLERSGWHALGTPVGSADSRVRDVSVLSLISRRSWPYRGSATGSAPTGSSKRFPIVDGNDAAVEMLGFSGARGIGKLIRFWDLWVSARVWRRRWQQRWQHPAGATSRSLDCRVGGERKVWSLGETSTGNPALARPRRWHRAVLELAPGCR